MTLTSRLLEVGKFLLFAALTVGSYTLIGLGVGPIVDALHIGAWFNGLSPGPMMVGELMIGVAVAIGTAVVALIERRSILSYGFSPQAPHARRYFLEGVAIGVISPAIIGLCMLVFGGMQIQGWGLSGTDWLIYPLGWLIVMLMVGFFEEAVFRGYGLVALARAFGFWPAAVLITGLFVLAHANKQGENWIDFASIAFLGFTMATTFLRTGSLWLAAGFHVAFDYMQFFVIGTKNGSQQPLGTLFHATFNGPAWVNGGPLGTEASYFVFPVTLAMLVFILWRYRDNKEFSRVVVQPGSGTAAIHAGSGQA